MRLRLRVEPELLRFGIGLDERDLFLRPPRLRQIFQRRAIDREIAGRGAEFRRHVRDHRPFATRQAGDSGAEELDEGACHVAGAQALRDGEREIGRAHALAQPVRQAHADDVGDPHHHRHAEHHALGLEPANAPSQHTDAVDHRRVAVGADQRVRQRPEPAVDDARRDNGRELFKVDRVHDAGARRMHAHAVQRLRRPFQEAIALAIALIFALQIDPHGIWRGREIDPEGVIDRDVDRQDRAESLGVASRRCNSIAHRRDIDERRGAGRVVHQHAARLKGDLCLRCPASEPYAKVGQGLIALLLTLGLAQHVLCDDAQHMRQSREHVAQLGPQVGDDIAAAGETHRSKGRRCKWAHAVNMHNVDNKCNIRERDTIQMMPFLGIGGDLTARLGDPRRGAGARANLQGRPRLYSTCRLSCQSPNCSTRTASSGSARQLSGFSSGSRRGWPQCLSARSLPLRRDAACPCAASTR